MIKLRRLNQEPFMVNADMIETVDESPDTVITMLSGRKFVVAESAEEIRDKVIDYRRSFHLAEHILMDKALPMNPGAETLLDLD